MPTFAESGLPTYKPRNWFGVAVPAGTPEAIVEKLEAEIARIRSLPHFKEQMALRGVDVFSLTREQFRAYIEEELATWAKVVKQANIQLGQAPADDRAPDASPVSLDARPHDVALAACPCRG